MTAKYNSWRKKVYAKNDFTCQRCFRAGTMLHAHHILNKKSHPELDRVVSNGITFCRECHNEFHKKYGTKKNNKQQVLEFKRSNPPFVLDDPKDRFYEIAKQF